MKSGPSTSDEARIRAGNPDHPAFSQTSEVQTAGQLGGGPQVSDEREVIDYYGKQRLFTIGWNRASNPL